MDIAEKIARAKTDYDAVKESSYHKGHTDGYTNGHAEGVAQGYENGYTEGQSQGKAEGFDEGYENGWGLSWDSIQSGGARANYTYAFLGWYPEGFKPKYNVRPTNASYMFYNFNGKAGSQLVDLADLFEKAGVALDMSRCTNFANMLYFARVSRLPVIDTRGASSVKDAFSDAQLLEVIDGLILKGDGSQEFNSGTNYNNTFFRCYNLRHMIVSGVIGSSWNLQYSENLDRESIDSILNCLADTDTGISGKTLTLSAKAVSKAYPGGSWDDDFDLLTSVITNWKFSLV